MALFDEDDQDELSSFTPIKKPEPELKSFTPISGSAPEEVKPIQVPFDKVKYDESIKREREKAASAASQYMNRGWIGAAQEAIPAPVKRFGSRLFFGEAAGDEAARRQAILNALPEDTRKKALATEEKTKHPIGKLAGTPESEQSIFDIATGGPLEHPKDEGWGGYAVRGAYNTLIRPLGTPSGLVGSLKVKPIPRVNPDFTLGPVDNPEMRAAIKAAEEKATSEAAAKLAQQQAEAEAKKKAASLVESYKVPERKALPPAPTKEAPKTTFYAGPSGTAEAGMEYRLSESPTGLKREPTRAVATAEDLEQGPIKVKGVSVPTKGAGGKFEKIEISPDRVVKEPGDILPTRHGTVLPSEVAKDVYIPGETAADIGTQFGREPYRPQPGRWLDPKTGKLIKTEIPQPYKKSALEAFQIPEEPKPDARPFGSTRDPRTGLWNIEPVPGEPGFEPRPQSRIEDRPPSPSAQPPKSSTPPPSSPAPPSPPSSPTSGGLPPIQQNLGFGPPPATPSAIAGTTPTPSWWKEVKPAIKDWATKRGQGARAWAANVANEFKDVTGPTDLADYQGGSRTGRLRDVEDFVRQREQDMTQAGIKNLPDFDEHLANSQSIPEALSQYEMNVRRIMEDKKFGDYLKSTGQMTSDRISKDSQFAGKYADDLSRYIKGNVLGHPETTIGPVGRVTGALRNVYLTGGIPGTKWNMHGLNVFKNDAKAFGFGQATKNFLLDPTGKKAAAWLENVTPAERELMAKLTDNGWAARPFTTGHDVNIGEAIAGGIRSSGVGGTKAGELAAKGADVLAKGQEFTQNIWERPLFERALPALNAKQTMRAYNVMRTAGMPEEEALKAAAKIGNEFYGGVNTAIRSKGLRGVAQIGVLAPNWAEAQALKSYQMWKSTIKTVAGQGTPLDKFYAKAFGRSVGLAGAGLGAREALGGNLTVPNLRDLAAVPLGRDSQGKQRSLTVLGTGDEEIRLPLALAFRDAPMWRTAAGIVGNKASTPLESVINITRGQNRFGGKLTGPGAIGELTKPIQLPAISGAIGAISGKMSPEEAAAQGLELPLAYSKPKGAFQIRLK